MTSTKPASLQLSLPLFEPDRAPVASFAPVVTRRPAAQPAARRARAAAPAASAPDRSQSAATETALDRLWCEAAPEWSRRWGVPDLRATVRVELSHRMRSSLGGFYPRERLIRITDVLLEAPPHLLLEILCHEAAHAAVHVLHGDRVRSHGREWRDLMRRAGLEPRVRVPGQELGPAAQRAARKRWLWRHRCPVCRAERLAGRPVRQWRCGPCRAAGRHGELVIHRVWAGSAELRR
ncbi:MAG TPA: SprT-like domain-containing protein [Thermoanaerobaculia bacterium]|nr:SprT-like domain-containing protein [Thermoanaerobaculia bacterium]